MKFLKWTPVLGILLLRLFYPTYNVQIMVLGITVLIVTASLWIISFIK